MLTHIPADLLADKAIASAVEYCRARVGSRRDVTSLLRQDYRMAHDYLRYGLALEAGTYLGEADWTVKAVYVCPDDQDDQVLGSALTMPLCLIVWADPAMRATERLLADLDEALTRAYRGLVAPGADGLRSLLDAHLVDDRAVLERKGFAALVDSVHQPATKVWHRVVSPSR